MSQLPLVLCVLKATSSKRVFRYNLKDKELLIATEGTRSFNRHQVLNPSVLFHVAEAAGYLRTP